MKMAFLINDFQTLKHTQTTAMLICLAAQRYETFVFDVKSFTFSYLDKLTAYGREVPAGEGTIQEKIQQVKQNSMCPYSLESLDVLMIRVNPARDKENAWAHDVALNFCEILKNKGVLVLNDPLGLRKAASKLYITQLPEHLIPKTIVTRELQEVKAFMRSIKGDIVLKPLQGTHGQDVFFVGQDETRNLHQIFDLLSRKGYAMVQEYVPEAAAGDIRLILLNGKLMEEDGKPAAVHRVPGPGDFRSNIHAGGKAVPPTITQAMRDTIATLGPILVKDGIFFAGLDFIGDKIVEINVFSTGGFQDAEVFTGVNFTEKVLQDIEEKFSQKTGRIVESISRARCSETSQRSTKPT